MGEPTDVNPQQDPWICSKVGRGPQTKNNTIQYPKFTPAIGGSGHALFRGFGVKKPGRSLPLPKTPQFSSKALLDLTGS